MNRPKAVVFDMDGVIYDTERLSGLGWREAGVIFGLSNIERTLQDCVGLNKTASDALLLERYGKSFPLDDFRSYTHSALQKRLEEDCPLKQGAKEILTWLTAEGIPIAMATSSRRQTAVERLERSGLLSHFSAIVGGDMVQNSKPHPEPYLTACSLLRGTGRCDWRGGFPQRHLLGICRRSKSSHCARYNRTGAGTAYHGMACMSLSS